MPLTVPACHLRADEISTGLDSSTTYQIMRCIRNICTLRDVRCPLPRLLRCLVPSRPISAPTPAFPSCEMKWPHFHIRFFQRWDTTSIAFPGLWMQATVMVSLLQPPPETFDLFHDLILIADGTPG